MIGGESPAYQSLLREGEHDPVKCYRFVNAEKAHHPVAMLCRVIEVSRSGFYAWLGRGPSARATQDAQLTGRIREIWVSP